MFRSARSFLTIAKATWLEAIQQPVAFLTALASVVLTLMVPVFHFHHFGEEGRLARDSGLSCLLLGGLVLAVGAAGRSVSREIEGGTAAAVIGKPVSRSVFLVAKWAGIFGVTLFFGVAQTAATLIAERSSSHSVVFEDTPVQMMDVVSLLLALGFVAGSLLLAAFFNWAFRKRFGVLASAGLVLSQLAALAVTEWKNPFVALNLRVLPAAVLVLAALAVFASLAVALAARFRTGTILAVCAGVLLLGLAGDTLFGSAGAFSLRGIGSGVLPDLQNFWLSDAVARGGRIAPGYLLEALAHAVVLCSLFLTAGCLLFRNRDLG
ncbi:MAG: ABC transporter permease [Kiritimatiellae bacterium]|nr:ABC transporter permease [Kiritimatiellia bacterium]